MTSKIISVTNKKKSTTMLFWFLIASLSFSLNGCMKTRAQIRNNQSGSQSEDTSSSDEGGSPNNSGKSSRYESEEIKNEIIRISGKLEEVEHQQRTQNFSELKEYVVRLDGRINELEKNQLLIMNELKGIKDKETAAAKEAAIPPTDKMTSAAQLLSEKKYEAAAEKFRAALDKGIKGKEAAEAYFGLGECEYGLKNYKKAIVQYSKVQETYSKSSRVPASLYRIGLAFQHLNMPKESKGFFSELVERYPKSAEAKKARSKSKE